MRHWKDIIHLVECGQVPHPDPVVKTKEDWKDVRTGKACGRRKGEKRGTPYCRPSKRVSSKTPKTTSEMSASEKKRKVAEKKRLGQPAGKPRRVSAVKRKKKVSKKK